jgi:hypothetical protein
MESSRCSSKSFPGLRIFATAVMLVAFLSGFAHAQWIPSLGNPTISLGNFFSGFSLSQLHSSDFKAGIFWGGGSMSIDHSIAPGPAPVTVLAGGLSGPAFPGFEHRRDTGLKDAFLAAEWGFRWGDMLAGALYLDTNIGRQTQFTQTTSASPGQTNFGGNPTLAVLFLPDNTQGVITLDNSNRMWNWDLCFAFPVMPELQFLVGWKYGRISSSLDPYSATVPSGFFGQLPGITNWENLWTVFGAASTTGFSITQSLWWSGPFVGLRLAGGGQQDLPGRCYVEGKVVPYAWGSYKFAWDGSLDALGFFLNGQQTTQAKGLRRYLLEVKGGTQVNLAGGLFLDVWAKYFYLNMNGSEPEVQSFQSNFTAVPALSQEADQTITMNVNFWGVGGDLVLPF